MTSVEIVSRISPDHGRARRQGRSTFRLNGPDLVFLPSGWPDLNRRPLDPQTFPHVDRHPTDDHHRSQGVTTRAEERPSESIVLPRCCCIRCCTRTASV